MKAPKIPLLFLLSLSLASNLFAQTTNPPMVFSWGTTNTSTNVLVLTSPSGITRDFYWYGSSNKFYNPDVQHYVSNNSGVTWSYYNSIDISTDTTTNLPGGWVGDESVTNGVFKTFVPLGVSSATTNAPPVLAPTNSTGF